MRKPFLTPPQEKALTALFAHPWIRRQFYLTGGTALAGFHYAHRVSDDLDLFTHGIDLTPADAVLRDISATLGLPLRIEIASPSYRKCFISDLKVDLVRDVDFRVGSPELIGGVMVDSVRNIAVNKVCAIYGRIEAKDYVDLHAILTREGWDILELIDLARRKDGGMDAFQWAQIIAEAESLKTLPKMMAPMDRAALAKFFRTLRDRILDSLKPGG